MYERSELSRLYFFLLGGDRHMIKIMFQEAGEKFIYIFRARHPLWTVVQEVKRCTVCSSKHAKRFKFSFWDTNRSITLKKTMTNAKLDFCRYLIFIIFSKKSLNTTMKCSFIIQQHTSLMVIISTQPTGGGCRPIAWRADLTLTNHAKSWSNADQSGGGRAVLRPPITLRGCFFRFLTLLHDVESTVTTQSFTLSLSFSIGQTHSAQLVVLCGGGGMV